MTSYCENCGKERVEDTQFCSECGARFQNTAPETQKTALFDSSFVKNSNINLSETSAGISAGGTDAYRTGPSINDSFIKEAKIDMSTTYNITQDGYTKEEMLYADSLLELFFEKGAANLYRFHNDQLIQLRQNLKLSEFKYIEIENDVKEKFLNYLDSQRSTEKYWLRTDDKDLSQRRLSANKIVSFLNNQDKIDYIPKVRTSEASDWISAWGVMEIFDHPDLKLRCAITGETCMREDVTICFECGLLVSRAHFDIGTNACYLCREKVQARIDEKNLNFARSQDRSSLENLPEQQWKRIPAGEFIMGSPGDESGRDENETQHPVILSKGLAVYYTVITDELYDAVMNAVPLNEEEKHPKVNISWFEAVKFCNCFSDYLQLKTKAYEITEEGQSISVVWHRENVGVRLLTEAEWEYCCRAGSSGPYYLGDRELLYEIAWYDEEDFTNVASLKPNGFGLYDMLGMVWEWVWDSEYEYTPEPVTDPSNDSASIMKLIRGGSLAELEDTCRCATRKTFSGTSQSSSIGFRVAISHG